MPSIAVYFVVFNARNMKRMEVIDEMRHVLFYIEQGSSHNIVDSSDII